jgi:hypothetical protein
MNIHAVRKNLKPLTVTLSGGSFRSVVAYQNSGLFLSLSEALRHVICQFDFETLRYSSFAPFRQISFRLPPVTYRAVQSCARKNRTSVGAIIRAALFQVLPEETQITRQTNRKETAMSTKKPAPKKPAAPVKPAPKKPVAPAKAPAPAKKTAPVKKPAVPAKKPAPAPKAAPAKKPAAPVKAPAKPAPKKPAAPAKAPVPAKKAAPVKKPAAPAKKAPGKK